MSSHKTAINLKFKMARRRVTTKTREITTFVFTHKFKTTTTNWRYEFQYSIA